jgi:hypothetical protein
MDPPLASQSAVPESFAEHPTREVRHSRRVGASAGGNYERVRDKRVVRW